MLNHILPLCNIRRYTKEGETNRQTDIHAGKERLTEIKRGRETDKQTDTERERESANAFSI